MNIFDFFTAINDKKNLLQDEPQSVVLYNSAMINQLLSQYPDAILHVNEMNRRPNCDDKLQFDYVTKIGKDEFDQFDSHKVDK